MLNPTQNAIRETIERDEPAVGAWLLSGSVRVAERLSQTVLDWIGIDTEHAPYSPERVENVIRAIEPRATPLVRLPSVEAAATGAAQRALDAGAGGIIVPGVDSPADAERVVSHARFPPTGDRGVAGTTRANAYGDQFATHLDGTAAEPLVVIQLESPTAVEQAEDILAVDRIDVAFVGENDLSSALGHPGEVDHPAVRSAVEQMVAAADRREVTSGIAGRSTEMIEQRANRGFRFFLIGADLSFIHRGVDQVLD